MNLSVRKIAQQPCNPSSKNINSASSYGLLEVMPKSDNEWKLVTEEARQDKSLQDKNLLLLFALVYEVTRHQMAPAPSYS